MGADSAHDSSDDEENDDEESALLTRTRKPAEAAKPSELETSSRGKGSPKRDTGKALVSPEVEIIPPSSKTIPEGVNTENPEANENAPSEELGAATTGHSLSLPTYSEGVIEEANALRMPDPSKVIEDDPFQGCYAGIEDANDLNDASTIFKEAQHLLSRFRAELSQCEVKLKKISGEEKALRLLCSQKEEEFKNLRTALAKAQKSEAEIDEQLRGDVDQVRANRHQWKKNMDQLAVDKDSTTTQLASVETQLRGIKAKGMSQARKIEELEAELAKARAEAVQAKAEAEKIKVGADKSIAIYLREAVAVQDELWEASDRGKGSNELAKFQSWRETLEEIHARGFNLDEEIAEAKAWDTDARFLISSDDKDVASGSGKRKVKKMFPKERRLSKIEPLKTQYPESTYDVIPDKVSDFFFSDLLEGITASYRSALKSPENPSTVALGTTPPAKQAPKRSSNNGSMTDPATRGPHQKDRMGEKMIEANNEKVETYNSRVDQIPGAPPVLKGMDSKKFIQRPLPKEAAPKPIPKNFRMPELPKYNGTSDPNEHITVYTFAVKGNDIKDDEIESVLLKKFREMLSKKAVMWYHNLSPTP
ncbi:uncharacterized protein [Nicotiana sylvestris]|uniref:uncharacterized protein n=1 Tax=Nicotiana sylvestris TaxID=4096 RepID=UPI00388CE42B